MLGFLVVFGAVLPGSDCSGGVFSSSAPKTFSSTFLAAEVTENGSGFLSFRKDSSAGTRDQRLGVVHAELTAAGSLVPMEPPSGSAALQPSSWPPGTEPQHGTDAFNNPLWNQAVQLLKKDDPDLYQQFFELWMLSATT